MTQEKLDLLLASAGMTESDLVAVLTDVASVAFGRVTINRNNARVTTVITERSRLLNAPEHWKKNKKLDLSQVEALIQEAKGS